VKCPKCGFVIQEAGSAACPKCGVVFAKVQRALAQETAFNRRTETERSISAVMEKRMEADEEVRSRLNFDPDPEYARDDTAYPVIHFLSGAFVFLAAATALIDIAGLIRFYKIAARVGPNHKEQPVDKTQLIRFSVWIPGLRRLISALKREF
jgi:uncharacterized Zn finger protein (UPF0148 family)